MEDGRSIPRRPPYRKWSPVAVTQLFMSQKRGPRHGHLVPWGRGFIVYTEYECYKCYADTGDWGSEKHKKRIEEKKKRKYSDYY